MVELMTVAEIEAKLRLAGIEECAEEALLLAAHVTGVPSERLRISRHEPLNDPDGLLSRAVARREAREPLQYLLGTWGFWRQEYEVGPDCLIPRADTETLVDYAVKHAPRGGRVLDLCTGSGCVIVSLLCERNDLSGVAVELYENTLAIARRNAARYHLDGSRLTFVRGDVLRGDFLGALGRFDMILSNPPYIPTATIDTLAEELHYEPRAALDGGTDGLTFYRRILQDDYCAALRAGGTMAFEIGYDQAEAVRALAAGAHCEILRDMSGQDRVAVITRPHILA